MSRCSRSVVSAATAGSAAEIDLDHALVVLHLLQGLSLGGLEQHLVLPREVVLLLACQAGRQFVLVLRKLLVELTRLQEVLRLPL